MAMRMRFTEEELRRDISGLDQQISEVTNPDDVSSRRVLSFLKQIVKDKRDKLATLRYYKSNSR